MNATSIDSAIRIMANLASVLHAVAGRHLGPDDRAAQRHFDQLRHHSADRNRNVGNADADRGRCQLVQIPYAVDELIASLQFVRRRVRVGQNWLRAFFAGDADERSADDDGHSRVLADEFDRSPFAVVKDMLVGGVGLPWNLGLSAVIGSSLRFTRLNFGTTGTMANAYHVIGFLVLTTLSIAAAEATRVVRYLNVLFGAALLHYTVPAGCGHGRDDQQHRLWSLSDRAQLPALANPPALRHMAGL